MSKINNINLSIKEKWKIKRSERQVVYLIKISAIIKPIKSPIAKWHMIEQVTRYIYSTQGSAASKILLIAKSGSSENRVRSKEEE